MIDAYMNRHMKIEDRIVAALRARFFLHIWRNHIEDLKTSHPDLYSLKRNFISPQSFQIFNRLCDSLVTLALIYAKYYPTEPFCPWLFGTEFVEHFFGLARTTLPDFTYAELIKMVKHIMLQQKIHMSGKFKEKKERTSACGYLFDYDAKPLSNEELKSLRVEVDTTRVDQLVKLAFSEAGEICRCILNIKPPPLPLRLHKLGSSTVSDADIETDGHESDNPDDDTDTSSSPLDNSCSSDTSYIRDIPSAALHASRDAARYSKLCADYEETLQSIVQSDSAGGDDDSEDSTRTAMLAKAQINNHDDSPHTRPIQQLALPNPRQGQFISNICINLETLN